MDITFNNAGFRELLTGPIAQHAVETNARAVAGRANSVPSTTSPAHDKPYYVVKDGSDNKRARRRVITDAPAPPPTKRKPKRY
ncbi:hypothetical protein [Mycolicibacterium insubricum]|uniref:hypothetical protein n=1 Tax=Mycolicibacterium insubricum TaxID=444597 RepID=UPI0021F2B4E4|nr:hypothetical protein [Mycolicibacterium insubricum]MCV7080276.1 hypothetical protein [Mycolicibacterium insubricum]